MSDWKRAGLPITSFIQSENNDDEEYDIKVANLQVHQVHILSDPRSSSMDNKGNNPLRWFDVLNVIQTRNSIADHELKMLQAQKQYQNETMHELNDDSRSEISLKDWLQEFEDDVNSDTNSEISLTDWLIEHIEIADLKVMNVLGNDEMAVQTMEDETNEMLEDTAPQAEDA